MDVKLFQTPDDGDIAIAGGVVEMTACPDTAAYLSLFGGDAEWWGNHVDAYKELSETQELLQSIPATTGNLRRILEAVKRDLAWLGSVEVSITLPALNHVDIEVTIESGETLNFSAQCLSRSQQSGS